MYAHAPMLRVNDVAVIGGCGHVGLPLAMALCNSGLQVVSFDIDVAAVSMVLGGAMPFEEEDGQVALEHALASGRFHVTSDPASIATAGVVIVVIGTPVDEYLNPEPEAVPNAIISLSEHFGGDQLIILRSTIYPGVTRLTQRRLAECGLNAPLAFCPERTAQGHALSELVSLPQIVSGCTPEAVERASKLFLRLTDQIVVVEPEEAELAKLLTNSWRYMKFAIANQFYSIVNDFGLDYERVRHAIRHDYPRAADLPGAGFAAGPCLLKDTMQLSAFNNNNFVMGSAAMMVNEGLPLYVVSELDKAHSLADKTVGLLGMSFKPESDDVRSSLSYKLRRILRFRCKKVLCTDPFVRSDPSLVSLEQVVAESDVIIIGAPHRAYRDLQLHQVTVDVTNLLGRGVRV
jgi:UDP-N-acetyl-D-mannosaminuronic acid dehydrogenase